MTNLYDSPKYYEIAFSFRNIPEEVDLFEKCFRRFSHITVESVLELGCGNSPHMEELVGRGYRYHGLDTSKAMLEYSAKKAERIGAEVTLFQSDMADFTLDIKTDFVFILLGSLSVKSTAELTSHLDSVSMVLKKGGLYFLDWCIQYDPPWILEGGGNWVMEGEGIKVKTTVSWKAIDKVKQTFKETIRLQVDDHGKKLDIVGKETKRAIFPQEFLCLIKNHSAFEFVGWWNNWDLEQPLEGAEKIDRPITLIRRV